MKIVIQCASKKRADAGHLINQAGKPISFVAHPAKATDSNNFARPDDRVDSSDVTWRQKLVSYNAAFRESGRNPLGLLASGALYTPPTYGELRRHIAATDVFILSAGWGLIRAEFLLPAYDITFSKQSNVARESRRSIGEKGWSDFNHLTDADIAGERVHFFGGSDYLDLFYSLAGDLDMRQAREVVVHHKVSLSHRSGYSYKKFVGSASTNWHYIAIKSHLLTPSEW